MSASSSAHSVDAPIFKIAFAFETSLPASWVISLQTFKRKLERAGVRTPVMSAPIEMLPADVDLVLAPRELADRVRERVRAEVFPLDAIVEETLLDRLVERLRAAQKIQARNSEKPMIVTYRGEEHVG